MLLFCKGNSMIKRKIDPDNLIWRSEYNIGSFKVDQEHQSLFKVAKKALNIRTLENDENEIKELKAIIKSLYEYVAEHFANEEKYMLSVEFPELKRHKVIHKDLLVMLHGFTQKLNSMDIDEIEVHLYKFIEEYFIHHIVDEDMLIGLWVNSLKDIRKTKVWKKEYETGNWQIDVEHKKMFSILDEVFTEVPDNNKEQKIKTVLAHLYDFIKVHFKNEERYMKKISYPKLQDHIEIHHKIVAESNELLKSIDKMDIELFEKQLALFIDEHIVGHMLKDDKKVVEFADSKNN
jgi:hemerythrin